MKAKKRLLNLISTFLGVILIYGACLFSASISWADTPTNFVVVSGQVKVKPEKRKDFITFAETLIKPSLSELGSISYKFYEDPLKENEFLYFEEWKNQEALDIHFQTPYFKEFVKRVPGYLSEPPVIKVYQVASFKVLN